MFVSVNVNDQMDMRMDTGEGGFGYYLRGGFSDGQENYYFRKFLPFLFSSLLLLSSSDVFKEFNYKSGQEKRRSVFVCFDSLLSLLSF